MLLKWIFADFVYKKILHFDTGSYIAEEKKKEDLVNNKVLRYVMESNDDHSIQIIVFNYKNVLLYWRNS